jgi:hypothetical protein
MIDDRDWVKNATSEQMVRLRREMEMAHAREVEAQAASAARVAWIVRAGLNILDQVRSIDLFGCGWGHCWRGLQLAEVRKEQEDEGDFDVHSDVDSPMEDEDGNNMKDEVEGQVEDEVENDMDDDAVEGHAKDNVEGQAEDEVEGEEVKREVNH